jgi:hypothetical protein
MSKNPPQDKQAILAALPQDVTRVQVKTAAGPLKWKVLADILNTDYIVLNPATGGPFTMKGVPGRKTLALPPGSPGQPGQVTPLDVQAAIRKKKAALASDPVVRAAGASPEAPEVLTAVLLALADEAASLAHERKKAEEKNEPTSAISIRRVNALKAIGDAWLKRKEQIAERGIDFESPDFKAVFGFISETFRAAMESARLSADVVETVFSKFGATTNTKEWENEARNRAQKAR